MTSSEASLVIGVVVSIALALIVYLLEAKQGGNRAAIIGALNMALLSLTLTALISHDFESRATLERTLPRIKSKTWQTIVGDIESLDREMAGAQEYARIHEITMEPLRRTLSNGIEEARMGIVVTGTVEETITLASDLMKEARHRIWVTSYISPSEWWSTNAGTEYSTRTKQAPSRVESFERIFIIDDEAELKFLRPVMKRQQSENIKVKYVFSQKVGKDLRRDFIVIDDLVAGEIELDEARRFVRGKFFTSKTMAEDFSQRFRQIGVWSADPAP